jgi:hypothetical protein
MATPIARFLTNFDNKFIVETYLEKEESMLQVMAKDIVAKLGNDRFVRNAVAQDTNTQGENPTFAQKGFLLACERTEWFKRNHKHIVAYSEVLINAGSKTIDSWAEWSRWNLPVETAKQCGQKVHCLSNKKLYDIFVEGDEANPYFEDVSAAFAMTMLCVITDRFLSWIEDAMATSVLMNAKIPTTKH